jgi:hypothetical protein
VHLDDLLGNGETKNRTALGFGVGIIDLVELFEDAGTLVLGDSGPRVRHAEREVAIHGRGAHAHLSTVQFLRNSTAQKSLPAGAVELVARSICRYLLYVQ